MKNWWVRSHLLSMALLVSLLSGTATMACGPVVPPALVATQPTVNDTQKVRDLAHQIKGVAGASIDMINALSEGLNKVPQIPVATKDAFDCTFMRIVGTKTPASMTVQSACGGPIPLAIDAPIAKAVQELDRVSTCPSLRTTVSILLSSVDPMLSKLENSGEPTAVAGSVSLRTMFAFMSRLLSGGAVCS